MKKLLFIPIMLFTLIGYSQVLNKTKNGYTEVVEVELSKKDIYQKINEWIAINYKSAQDVVQLNTEDKVVIKGNYTFLYPSGEAYGVRNTTTISIRENKYKIELIPTSIFVKKTMKDALPSFIEQFFVDEAPTYEEFKPWHRERVIKIWQNEGRSERRIQKLAKKHITDDAQKEGFEGRQAVFLNWNKPIKSTFSSIKNSIVNPTDDW
jgi:hypothetical protein